MMKKRKRERLEAAGWKVGSAEEFLGLTDEEAAMIELKLELAKALKEARVRRKMTQQELGKRLGSSQSRVAKMEAGDPSVSVDLLVRSLFKLGASRRGLARHLAASPKQRAA
jgi:DNA-binding XRE family transcriptional regulator